MFNVDDRQVVYTFPPTGQKEYGWNAINAMAFTSFARAPPAILRKHIVVAKRGHYIGQHAVCVIVHKGVKYLFNANDHEGTMGSSFQDGFNPRGGDLAMVYKKGDIQYYERPMVCRREALNSFPEGSDGLCYLYSECIARVYEKEGFDYLMQNLNQPYEWWLMYAPIMKKFLK